MTNDIRKDKADRDAIVQAEKQALPDCMKHALGIPGGANPISSGQYSRLRADQELGHAQGPQHPHPHSGTRLITSKGNWAGHKPRANR